MKQFRANRKSRPFSPREEKVPKADEGVVTELSGVPCHSAPTDDKVTDRAHTLSYGCWRETPPSGSWRFARSERIIRILRNVS